MEPIKCDACGRFISHEDIDSGKAIRTMNTPDSYYSSEAWTILCPKCKPYETSDSNDK